MYVCIVHHDGAILGHRTRQAAPEPLLQAVAPARDGLVVAVACLFTWYGLADRCTPEGMPVGLGHALAMTALHGGKAKNATIASPKMAARLRGGLLRSSGRGGTVVPDGSVGVADAGADGGQTTGRRDDEHGLVKLAHGTLGPSLPVHGNLNYVLQSCAR